MNEIPLRAGKLIQDNASSILTGLGVSGVVSTAYLSGKASFRASERLSEEDPHLPRKEKFRRVWSLYVPTAISGALTIGCIVTGAKVGSKKTAAVYSVLTAVQSSFDEYREKVVEQIGEKKEQEVRDSIVQDRLDRNPVSSAQVLMTGSGEVLCYEMYTGRYFHCDMETLRKAQNDINAKLIRECEATLHDFYYMINIPRTSTSSGTGWRSEKMMSLDFSPMMSDDGRPCLAFDYNYVEAL